MIVSRIEAEKKKHRVYVDEEYMFSLYSNELGQFNIQEGNEISNDVITYILDTIIYKRAKERALFLLERKPLSVHMMKNKLQENGYPVDLIERVIAFLECYHYLDDDEYTRMYVDSYAERKSRKQILNELYHRGISKQTIENYFELNEYSEKNCFEKQFLKYVKGKNLQDYNVRQKVFRYFYSKGFSIALIEKYIKHE